MQNIYKNVLCFTCNHSLTERDLPRERLRDVSLFANAAGIAKLPDNLGACKNLSNLEASVNPLGKYVCLASYMLSLILCLRIGSFFCSTP